MPRHDSSTLDPAPHGGGTDRVGGIATSHPISTAPPTVIQGGMGVGVSSWALAQAVCRGGQLGVVSGTALDAVLARRLQDGDPGGHARRALAHFPVPAVADRLLTRYYRDGGRASGQPYAPIPKLGLVPSTAGQQLAIAGNFVEVWLAKDGHDNPVGINFLEKVQLATPAAAYGAMLAGVDYVLMGAGIPAQIPALLDALAAGDRAELAVTVDGATQPYAVSVDPASVLGTGTGNLGRLLRRPALLAIVSTHVLAAYLARDPATRPDGFVMESPAAGGHNAPPRRNATTADGQTEFGPRDETTPVDLAKLAALGLPFWLAGSRGTPGQLAAAVTAGATGVQVGTLFALSEESGLQPHLRRQLLDQLTQRSLTVRTEPATSPTGFPFKVVALPGTLSEPATYEARPRLCDLGYLRMPYERSDGKVGYRCPAEPVHMYQRKGGELADTIGRKCLCNALTADVGLGQTRADGYVEEPLVTLGSGLDAAADLLALYPDGWNAAQVLAWLLTDVAAGGSR